MRGVIGSSTALVDATVAAPNLFQTM
ncbi:hypothetical protein SCAR479_11694 [Seiridium cardinale]|uniref:Uncharacterized protein n=1 Tax=Seiridium cardinale TaxID=138064 RepID=A0ABR2XCU9_9PEZI